MKIKNVLLMGLSLVLVAALAIGGTVAYLTDTDSDVNVMTLGNVSIAQHEYQRAEGVAHNATAAEGDLVPFVQGQPLYPAVPTADDAYEAEQDADKCFHWGDYSLGWNGLWNDSKLANVMDKFVFVENTGKSDAYYRTLIALECPEGMTIGLAANGAEIEANVNGNYRFDWDYEVGYITIDGTRYEVWSVTYTDILTPGEVSRPSLLQVILTHHATNEDMELLGNTYDILVLSQAVQAAGFDNAATALDTAFGDDNVENAAKWFGGITIAEEPGITEGGVHDLTGDVYTIDSAYFHTQKVSGDTVTINGNGATVEGIATSVDAFQWEEGGTIPAMSAIFSSADGNKVTVNDLKFTGTMSAIMLGHYVDSNSNWYNTEFNNVDVIGTKVVSFSANIAPAVCVYGTAVLNNCNVYGTTLSELDTDPMWPVYDVAAVNYSDLTINNSKIGTLYMWNQAKVTVADGSEVDTIVIRGNMNTSKYGLTIEAGATVGEIDLSAIATKTKVNITIEDGATVGKIIANGVEYATIAEWQNAQ